MVGTASIDRLHLATGECVSAAGGAGLYTALALGRAGVRAALFAPRARCPPEPLRRATAGLVLVGPAVDAEELPRLEIAHHGGGRATLVAAAWGGAGRLAPAGLPDWAASARLLHVAALPTADQQRLFTRWAREHGAARVSAGTFARAAAADPEGVRALLADCDVFFMNENEAGLLFGGLDAVPRPRRGAVFVTRGERGARVLEPAGAHDVEARPAREVDPTGAGDAFCGATLAALDSGAEPVEAARAGARLAAAVVSAVGPDALLGAGPGSAAP